MQNKALSIVYFLKSKKHSPFSSGFQLATQTKKEKKDSNRTNKRASQQPRKGEKLFPLSDQEQSMFQTGQNSWKWVSWNVWYENFMPPKQKKKKEKELLLRWFLRTGDCGQFSTRAGGACPCSLFKMLWWLKREGVSLWEKSDDIFTLIILPDKIISQVLIEL